MDVWRTTTHLSVELAGSVDLVVKCLLPSADAVLGAYHTILPVYTKAIALYWHHHLWRVNDKIRT